MDSELCGRSADPAFPVNDLEQELAELYTQYAPGLLRYARMIIDDTCGAQDAVQETFLSYFVARTNGRELIGLPKAWLFRVLRNYLLDTLRSSRVKNEVAMDGIADSPDRSNDPERQYQRAEIARGLSKTLAPRELECVSLRAEGLSYDEIAQIMDLRQGTVGATLARAHLKMRRVLSSTTEAQNRITVRRPVQVVKEEASYSS